MPWEGRRRRCVACGISPRCAYGGEADALEDADDLGVDQVEELDGELSDQLYSIVISS